MAIPNRGEATMVYQPNKATQDYMGSHMLSEKQKC